MLPECLFQSNAIDRNPKQLVKRAVSAGAGTQLATCPIRCGWLEVLCTMCPSCRYIFAMSAVC